MAKYFIYIGLSRKETEKRIKSFLLECDPGTIVIDWEDVIDRAIRFAKKYPPIILDGVPITKAEFEKIDRLDGRQLRRLAFTLLAIAKYRDAISTERCMWVNTPDTEIMKMANINTSIKRQSLMFSQLKEAGMIRFANKVDNTNIEVLFAEPGDTAYLIKDYRNLGYQYLMYHGENYFVCDECGITEKCVSSGRGRKHKYCANCATRIHMEQMVNAVMRNRALKKKA